MDKRDIHSGFVVELRNKQKLLVGRAGNYTSILVNPLTQEWCYLSSYDNDLKHGNYMMKDIMRVWGLVKGTSNYWAALLPYTEDRELLWERDLLCEREGIASILEQLEIAFHELGNALNIIGKDE